MDAYKVGVAFALNGTQVSDELARIVSQLLKASTAAEALAGTLKSIGMTGPGAGTLSSVARDIDAVGISAQRATGHVERFNNKAGLLDRAAASAGRYGPMAAGYAGYEALKGGMTMEDTIARALIAAGVRVGPNYMDTGIAAGLQKSIQGTSTSYGVSLGDTQDAALQAMRALAPLSADDRMRLLPSLMNFAGAEVLGKHGTTMQEAVEAGIGLAHQLRAYSPEQIEPMLGAFAKLSMASPASLSQMSRASSYYLPLLTAGLGMDPTALMALGTVGSQMGLNTKSGTWLAQMFQAPFVSDLTGKRQSARRKALEELGLVVDGKPVTRDPMEFLGILASHSSSMSPEMRMKELVAAFGQQGARAAAIFTDPAVMNNLMGLAEGLKTAQSPEQLRKQYGMSPLVKFHQAEETFMTTLTKLGQTVLPLVNTGLMGLTGMLIAVQNAIDWIRGHRTQVSAGMGGFSGAVVGGSWFGSLFGSSASVPPQSGQSVTVQQTINLDGRPLAKTVTEHQVGAFGKMPSSGNDFDLRASPLMPGFSPYAP